MNRVLVSVPSVLLAIVCAACGDSSRTYQDGSGGSSAGCVAPLSACTTGCVNLQSDSQNCGTCGQPCSVGQTCQSGACACAAGFMLCPSGCVDTRSDSANCGNCGIPCTDGQVCSQGTCSSSGCGALTQCGASCVDTSNSALYCGNCVTQCLAGQTCSAGTCIGGSATGGAGGTGGASSTTGGMGPTGGTGQTTGGEGPAGGTTSATGGAGPTGGTSGINGGQGGTTTTGGRTGRGGNTAVGGATGGSGPTGGAGGVASGGAPTGGNSSATGGSTGTGGGPAAAEPVLITSSDGNWWKEGTVTTGSGNATITVNASTTYQKWIGFGGSFNEKGWDAMAKLSAADRELALKLLFSKTEGAGFVYGRVPIGASDYGTDRYTLDDNAGDTSMSKFSIDRDKQRLIPYIKAALAVNPDIILWATVWTPPPWMKDNNAYDRGNMKSDATTLTAYALYLSKFVQAYAGENIKIAAVGPQNEPGYAQDYPSCVWSSSTYKDFVANYMGPQFAADIPSTEIWLATMSNPTSTSIVSAVMGDSKAKGYIKAIGLQWGMMDQGANYARTYSPLPIIQTEHKCGNYPWEGGYRSDKAPNDLAYGNESWGYIRDWITKQNGNSYNAWNMVLDTIGRSLDNVRPWNQNAPLTVDTGAGKLIQTPTYYVFRHASQFVDPGAVRVQTSASDGFAFKNPDGHIVLVMKTGGGGGQTTVGIGSTTLSFQAPANGWVTLNYQGG